MAAEAVAITGLGLFTAAGLNAKEVWQSISTGSTGIKPVTRFDTTGFVTQMAGEIEPPPPPIAKDDDAFVTYAVLAAQEAWQSAGLEEIDPSQCRMAVAVGSSSGGHNTEDLCDADAANDPCRMGRMRTAAMHNRAAIRVGQELKIPGPRITLSAACASGNMALAWAHHQVSTGAYDVVLVGGSDALSLRRFSGFSALGVLAPGICAPFSYPIGMNLGEGAAFLVVESAAHAARRHAQPRAWIQGCGSSSDGHHATAPDPTGGGIARALSAALHSAGQTPDALDCYSAHATGTAENDAAEWRAVQHLLGHDDLPTFALKSTFGHTFGAAGTIEAAVTVLSMEKAQIPATFGFHEPRAVCPTNPGREGKPRPLNASVALTNNSGFGGSNCSILIGRHPPPKPSHAEREVYVTGIGTGWVKDRAALFEFLASTESKTQTEQSLEGREVRVGRLPSIPVARELRINPRELDPSATWLATAASRALADSGLRIRGSERDHVGLMVGVSRRPEESNALFRKSFEERGPLAVSAQAFSRTVLSAAPGAAARVLATRGPTATLASGPGSGLHTFVYAMQTMRHNPQIQHMVASCVDEIDPWLVGLNAEDKCGWAPPEDLGQAEGCAAAVLSTENTQGIRVAGASLCGPGQLAEAIELATQGQAIDRTFSTAGGAVSAALEQASLQPHHGEWVPSPAEITGFAEASTSLLALAHATSWLGTCERPARALVISASPEVGTCAVLLATA